MAPTTIVDSFSKLLPSLSIAFSLDRDTRVSSAAVDEATSPMFWFDRKVEDYDERADRVIAAVRDGLSQCCLPCPEPSLGIFLEADVVRAAALYLLHPVNMALTAKYPGAGIVCRSEATNVGGTRPDVTYTKNGKVFAVLEFKNTGVVITSEFEKAKVSLSARPEDVSGKVADATENDERTLFLGNSLALTKQMVTYSEQQDKTDYVALFNWDYMFLGVFDKNASYMHGTFLGRTSSRVRKSFLGWLLEAFDNDGHNPFPPRDLGNNKEATRKSGRQSEKEAGGAGSSGSGQGGAAAGRPSGGSGGPARELRSTRSQGPARGSGSANTGASSSQGGRAAIVDRTRKPDPKDPKGKKSKK